MTKKDYNKIANIFNTAFKEKSTIEELMQHFIVMTEIDNPRFSKAKFLNMIKEREIKKRKNFEIVSNSKYPEMIKYMRLERRFNDPKTPEEALDLSIEKWKVIVEYYKNPKNTIPLYERGNVTCGLCIFYTNCIKCPIFLETKQKNCKETPCTKYMEDELSNKKLLSCAKKELNFLYNIKEKELKK